MTIQINPDWRIGEASGDFYLENQDNHGWGLSACYGSVTWALLGYVQERVGAIEAEDFDTPADLKDFLRKLTAEIEAATQEQPK